MPKLNVSQIMSMWNRVYAQTYDGNCVTILPAKNHGAPQRGAVRTELNQNVPAKPLHQPSWYFCSARAEFSTALAAVCKWIICM